MDTFASAEPEHLRLVAHDDGFTIGRPPFDDYVARRVATGWRVRSGDRPEWQLQRAGRPGDGFVLVEADGAREVGRTTPLEPAGFLGGIRYLVVADGRMFRIAPAPPRQTGFELMGWETAGAYMIARPEPSGWMLTSTPAGAGMTGIGAMLILFAAETLDGDSAL